MTIFFSKVEAEIVRREQQERVPLSRFFFIEDCERSHVNNCEDIDMNYIMLNCIIENFDLD